MKTILDVQKYWDSRPCNIRRSPAPVGSPKFFEDTERNKYFVEPHIPKFADFWNWTGKKVLEIGCGIGIDTVNFARKKADVTAVDLSEESLALARKRVDQENLKVRFCCANAEDFVLPVSRESFDLVYAFGSIHHSPHPEDILDNARYFLKPGGTLKIMVYNKYSWKSLWILLKYGYGQFWKFRELIARYSEAQTGCPITHTYSKRELRAMLERNGFHVHKMEKAHIFRWSIPEYREHKYVEAFPWNICPEWLFKKLESWFGWHWLVEATV